MGSMSSVSIMAKADHWNEEGEGGPEEHDMEAETMLLNMINPLKGFVVLCLPHSKHSMNKNELFKISTVFKKPVLNVI